MPPLSGIEDPENQWRPDWEATVLHVEIRNEAQGRVRPMARHDVPVVAAMIQRLSGQALCADIAALDAELRAVASRRRGLVAERFGYVVGYALMATDEAGNALHLQQLFVIEGSRGRGLGRALVDAAADLAREMGHRHVRADAPAEAPHARSFYRALGFEESGGEPLLRLA